MEWLAWYASNGAPALIEAGIWLPIFPSQYQPGNLGWADTPNHPNFDDFTTVVVDNVNNNAINAFWNWAPAADPFLMALGTAVAPIWDGSMTAQEALSAAIPSFRAALGI
jgi:multiple sugar transport system substrate-binding protein